MKAKEERMSKTRDIMTSDPVFVGPEDSAQSAAQLMKTNHVGPIPVVDREKKLVGIVTDRDLALKVVAEGRAPAETKVADVMSRDPYTCGPNDDVEQAYQTMEEHQIRRVPIVDEECHLIGIVAQADIATRAHQEDRLAKTVEGISKPSEAESR
jgi:CBS domain-containing protein